MSQAGGAWRLHPFSTTLDNPSRRMGTVHERPVHCHAHFGQRIGLDTFRQRCRWLVIAVASAFASLGCKGSEPLQFRPIEGTEPRQFDPVGAPEIRHHPDPDSLVLIASVTVADSIPHIQWTATRVRLQSDLGLDTLLTAVPFACLQPEAGSPTFPFNFRWLACNRVGVELDAASSARVAVLEQAMTGRLMETHPFQARGGALLVFEVPIGRDATAEAVRRARGFDYVRDAYRISLDPECVRSDVVPRPPCPPWSFVLRIPYAYVGTSPQGQDGGLVVPVRPGGWIRLDYRDPDGATHRAQYTVP